ncbi:MAG TPA: phage tail tape measure protein [Armatimonadota bacterium]|jgi:TP901 family phage tail tape measure protein
MAGLKVGELYELFRLEDQATPALNQAKGGFLSFASVVTDKLHLVEMSWAGVAAAAMKAAGDMGSANRTIQFHTGETGAKLGDLKSDFRTLAKDSVEGLDTIASAMDILHQRSGLVGETLREVTDTALEAGRQMGEEGNLLADYGSKVGNAWEISGAGMRRVFEMFFVASQRSGAGMSGLMGAVQANTPALQEMGYSLQESVALIANLEKHGASAEPVLVSLKMALNNLSELGVADAGGALKHIIEQIKSAPDALSKISIAKPIFGARMAAPVVRAIEIGGFNTTEMQAYLATSDQAIAKGKAIRGLGDELKRSGNQIAVSLAPAGALLNSILKSTLPLVTGIAVAMGTVAGSPIGIGIIRLALIYKTLAMAQTFVIGKTAPLIAAHMAEAEANHIAALSAYDNAQANLKGMLVSEGATGAEIQQARATLIAAEAQLAQRESALAAAGGTTALTAASWRLTGGLGSAIVASRALFASLFRFVILPASVGLAVTSIIDLVQTLRGAYDDVLTGKSPMERLKQLWNSDKTATGKMFHLIFGGGADSSKMSADIDAEMAAMEKKIKDAMSGMGGGENPLVDQAALAMDLWKNQWDTARQAWTITGDMARLQEQINDESDMAAKRRLQSQMDAKQAEIDGIKEVGRLQQEWMDRIGRETNDKKKANLQKEMDVSIANQEAINQKTVRDIEAQGEHMAKQADKFKAMINAILGTRIFGNAAYAQGFNDFMTLGGPANTAVPRFAFAGPGGKGFNLPPPPSWAAQGMGARRIQVEVIANSGPIKDLITVQVNDQAGRALQVVRTRR